MAKDSQKRVDVKGDGRIVLEPRQGSKKGIYHARLSVPNASGYKRFSTKTSDLEEAKYVAQKAYEELYFHVLGGGSLHAKLFDHVFDEWSAEMLSESVDDGAAGRKATVDRVKSYAKEFFGKRRIDEITAEDFFEFWAWRRENYAKKAPAPATLKREKTSISSLFNFALNKGYISKLPEYSTPTAQLERRPTFTNKEWNQIVREAKNWLEASKGKPFYRSRYVFYQYFFVLAYSGMRIGEARNLRWEDFRTLDDDAGSSGWLVANVRGKTGVREIVFHPEAVRPLRRLYEMQERGSKEKPDLRSFVFAHPDGTPIKSMKRSFGSLLTFLGIPLAQNGKPRALYSLRHFYATQRLSEDANPYLLAKQMGTSVDMLEKHYGHLTTANIARQLIRGAQLEKTKPAFS